MSAGSGRGSWREHFGKLWGLTPAPSSFPESASDDALPVPVPNVQDTEDVSGGVLSVVQPEVQGEPVSEFRRKAGLRVRVSYIATVAEDQVTDNLLRLDRGHDSPWTELVNKVQIEVIGPDAVPGTIFSAGGALWVTRRSNKRDSLRVMPVDLSGRLRTLPIEVFGEKYPKAKILFDPRVSGMYLSRPARADWERTVLSSIIQSDEEVRQ